MAQQQPGGTGRILTRLMVIALLIVASFGLVSAGPRAGVGAQEPSEEITGAEAGALVAQQADTVGDAAVVAVEALSYRDGPSLGAGVLTLLPQGTGGMITDGPIVADGYTWWEFTLDGAEAGAVPGWVAGEFLALAEGTATGYAVGDEVVAGGDDLHLRAAPGTASPIVAALSMGMQLTIASAPVTADGYSWYQIDIPAQAGAGWVAGEFLVPSTVADGFDLGATVVVAADGLNMRDAPTINGSVVQQLAVGTEGIVTGGPLVADGYTWYQIAIDGPDNAGWVAGEFLSYP